MTANNLAAVRQHRHLQRPRHRPKSGEGLSVPRVVDGGQRPGARPYRGIPFPHALLEEHGHLRNAGRRGRRNDHVDAQSSVLLVISPWAKRGYVSHRQTTIVSIHRTIYEILGLPALNMFDALANDFSDCFTTTPDFRPYVRVPVDPAHFRSGAGERPERPGLRQARRTPSISMDDDDEVEKVLRRGEKEEQRAR